jgi:hypothetical protein
MIMKKLMMLVLCLMLAGCSTTKKVNLSKKVTVEFYSVSTCAQCKAFKKNAIPYFKKRYGSKVTIKMYDMDAKATAKVYDNVIKSLKDFDQKYYGMSPFVNVKGYFAYLGYRTGDEEEMAKDIEAAISKKKLTSSLSGHRFSYKS